MNILAVETSGDSCSVALQTNGISRFKQELEGSKRSRNALAMLAGLLEEVHLLPSELNLITWSAGPGSFTGLRIGASICQAIAYVHRVPILSLSTLHIYAQAVRDRLEAAEGQSIAVAIDARMGEIYWASFICRGNGVDYLEIDQLIPAVATLVHGRLQGSSQWLLAGDGWHIPELQVAHLSEYQWIDIAGDITDVMMGLANRTPSDQWLTNPEDCMPHYLRGATQWKKRERIHSVVEPIATGSE